MDDFEFNFCRIVYRSTKFEKKWLVVTNEQAGCRPSRRRAPPPEGRPPYIRECRRARRSLPLRRRILFSTTCYKQKLPAHTTCSISFPYLLVSNFQKKFIRTVEIARNPSSYLLATKFVWCSVTSVTSGPVVQQQCSSSAAGARCGARWAQCAGAGWRAGSRRAPSRPPRSSEPRRTWSPTR